MGLFDDMIIEYPLPKGSPTEYQTKSIYCIMARYKIDASGKLLKAKYKTVKRPKKEVDAEYEKARKEHAKRILDNPNYKSIFPLKRRTTERVLDKWVQDLAFSGLIEAYTYDEKWWYDVSFLIDDGQVVKFKGMKKKKMQIGVKP